MLRPCCRSHRNSQCQIPSKPPMRTQSQYPRGTINDCWQVEIVNTYRCFFLFDRGRPPACLLYRLFGGSQRILRISGNPALILKGFRSRDIQRTVKARATNIFIQPFQCCPTTLSARAGRYYSSDLTWQLRKAGVAMGDIDDAAVPVQQTFPCLSDSCR